MPKILWLSGSEKILTVLKSVSRTDTQVDIKKIEKRASIVRGRKVRHTDEMTNDIIKEVQAAEEEGYQAVIIGCFVDPALREARGIVEIPIVGPGESCFYVASLMARRFGVITPRYHKSAGGRQVRAKLTENARLYGIDKNIVSWRHLPVLDPVWINDDNDYRKTKEKNTLKALEEGITEMKKSIEEDGAEALVLGCTYWTGKMKKLIEELEVPVLDPVIIPFKIAELLADLYMIGLKPSRAYSYGQELIDQLDDCA